MKKYLREISFEPHKQLVGKKPRKRIKEVNGKLYSIEEYNIHSELEKKIIKNKSKIVETIIENSYDDKGRLLGFNSYIDGKVKGGVKYEYGKNGLVVRDTGGCVIPGEESSYENRYDEYGNVVYKFMRDREDQEYNYKEYTEYHYNDLIKEDSKRSENDKGKIKKHERYEEGPQGYKLVIEERNDYDSSGELIKCFKENKTYYGDVEKRKEEEVVTDESKRKEIIKEIKDKCRGFMEKKVKYKEEELVVIEVKKIYSVWDKDHYTEVGIPTPRFKIRGIVLAEPDKWDRKDYELEVGYVLEEGYKMIRGVGESKEEIRLLNLYEYDIEKGEKGKVFREEIEKRVSDSRGRRIEWLYDRVYESKYDIIKKRYDGENQVEKITERRRYNKYKRELGRLLERSRKVWVYYENGNLKREENYKLKKGEEVMERVEEYNERGDLVETRVWNRKGEERKEVVTTEEYDEERKRRLSISMGPQHGYEGREEKVEIVEEDEDGDPRLIIEIDKKTGDKEVVKYEYYEGEYY